MVLCAIPNWRPALKNCVDALKPDGLLVFTLNHPCFERLATSWARHGFERVDRYLDEYQIDGPHGTDFHRPLSTYLNAVVDRGCTLVELVEPRLPEDARRSSGYDRTTGSQRAAGDGGRGETENGPSLAAETARRLACDSSLVAMVLRDGLDPLNVGHSTRSVPRPIRRTLIKRDCGCRFPACTERRFVDGHHIHHWAKGVAGRGGRAPGRGGGPRSDPS